MGAGAGGAGLDAGRVEPDAPGLSTERANAQAELRAAQQDYARLQSIADIAARKDVVAAELRLSARDRDLIASRLSAVARLLAPSPAQSDR